MPFEDKTLKCKDCGQDFVFTAAEQEFYASKNFQNEPGRCPSCRAEKKRQFRESRGPRQMYPVICSECGKEATVPFQPKGDKPVLCDDCFKKQREQGRQPVAAGAEQNAQTNEPVATEAEAQPASAEELPEAA